MEGSLQTLAVLGDRGIPCGIVSAHRHDDLLQKILDFEIHQYFDYVIGGAYHKDEALLKACRELGCLPEEVFFVGDMLSDMRDGRKAGVKTVLLAPEDSPYRKEADHHITELRTLLCLIK